MMLIWVVLVVKIALMDYCTISMVCYRAEPTSPYNALHIQTQISIYVTHGEPMEQLGQQRT